MTTQYIFYVFGGTLLFFLFISLLFRSKRGTIQDYYWGGNSLSVGNVSSLILSNSFSMNGLLYQAWLHNWLVVTRSSTGLVPRLLAPPDAL
jgi:hypothetical protein